MIMLERHLTYPQILECEFTGNRNGVLGRGFKAARFTAKLEDGNIRRFVAVMFDIELEREDSEFSVPTAVLDLDLLLDAEVDQNENTWRGDAFHDQLHAFWTYNNVRDKLKYNYGENDTLTSKAVFVPNRNGAAGGSGICHQCKWAERYEDKDGRYFVNEHNLERHRDESESKIKASVGKITPQSWEQRLLMIPERASR